MAQAVSEHVTLVELLELTQPYAHVAPLLQRAVQRLAREGVPGLQAMHFTPTRAGGSWRR